MFWIDRFLISFGAVLAGGVAGIKVHLKYADETTHNQYMHLLIRSK